MKKGIPIVILFGLIIAAFLYMSPSAPDMETAEEETMPIADEETESGKNLDAKVDEYLAELQTGTVPPMQVILKLKGLADENPTHIKSNLTLGQLSIQTGQFDKAVSRFEIVLKTDSVNAEVWELLAQTKLQLQDTVGALQSFETAVKYADADKAKALEAEIVKLK